MSISLEQQLLDPELAADQATQEPMRPAPRTSRRSIRQVYDWPAITIGRLIDGREARPKWNEYSRKLKKRNDSKAWHLGRLIPLDDLMCVYVSPKEMNAALTERYSLASTDRQDARRRQIARNLVKRLQGEICDISRAHDREVEESLLQVNPDMLRKRILDPDNPRWARSPELTDDQIRFAQSNYEAYDPEDFARQMLLTKKDRLWQPATFGLGDLNGCGPRLFGHNVDDEHKIMTKERKAFLDLLVGHGLAPDHFKAEWTPQLPLIKMESARVDNIGRLIPNCPVNLPLEAPAVIMVTESA